MTPPPTDNKGEPENSRGASPEYVPVHLKRETVKRKKRNRTTLITDTQSYKGATNINTARSLTPYLYSTLSCPNLASPMTSQQPPPHCCFQLPKLCLQSPSLSTLCGPHHFCLPLIIFPMTVHCITLIRLKRSGNSCEILMSVPVYSDCAVYICNLVNGHVQFTQTKTKYEMHWQHAEFA